MSKNNNQLSVIDTLKPSESSLKQMVWTYKDKLLKRASVEIINKTPEKQEQFLMRLISEIVKNDGLKECFTSSEGKVSIFQLIDDCLKTGLMLGKHAYPVPYKKSVMRGGNKIWVTIASFQIKREGFHSLLCGGQQPLFKDLRWSIVYEKEKNNIKIDKATGEISHPACLESDPGAVIGCWVQAINIDGSKVCNFYPIKYINNIRDNHSQTYQNYLSKKISNCSWITDPIPMIEKTAIKSFCRPYAEVKEELANAIYSEGDEIISESQNIEDVAESVIDSVIDRFDEVNIESSENTVEVNNDSEIKQENNDNNSLF